MNFEPGFLYRKQVGPTFLLTRWRTIGMVKEKAPPYARTKCVGWRSRVNKCAIWGVLSRLFLRPRFFHHHQVVEALNIIQETGTNCHDDMTDR